jgi:hypothetical protein
VNQLVKTALSISMPPITAIEMSMSVSFFIVTMVTAERVSAEQSAGLTDFQLSNRRFEYIIPVAATAL